MVQQFNVPILWNSQNIGSVNIFQAFYPLSFVMGWLGSLGLSYPVIQKLVFFIPITFIAPLSSYFFIKYITKSDIAAFIGSIVYCYNTYFLHGQTSHLTIIAAYSFIPITLLFALQSLEKPNLKHVITTSFFLYIVSFYEFRIFYLTSGLLLLMMLFHIVVNRICKLKLLAKIVGRTFTPIILVMIAHIYWILPLSQLQVISNNTIFSRDLFGGIYMSIASSLTLFHPFWTGNKPAIFVKQPIMGYFWLIPFIAIGGIYTHRRNRYIVLISIIALIGIFLSKQENIPFTNIYPLLYTYVPGFNAFREASKFYVFIIIGYSVLIGSFIDWIWHQKKIKYHSILKYGLTAGVIVLFLWNTKSYISGKIETLFVPREIPQDYITFKSFVQNQDDFFRTLWIPTISKWSYTSQTHPTISFSDTNWTCSNETDCTDIIKKQISDTLLDSYTVKYVIVPIEDTKNDDDFFSNYLVTRYYFIKTLNKLPYLKRIDNLKNGLIIYENKDYVPHISTVNKKDTSVHKLSVTQINPTHYVIHNIDQANSELLFTESYHPDWKLRIGPYSWFDSLINTDYFYSSKYHAQTSTGINKWEIKKDYISKDQDISKIHLVFAPQATVYQGLFITGAILFVVTCISALYFYYDSKNKNRN